MLKRFLLVYMVCLSGCATYYKYELTQNDLNWPQHVLEEIKPKLNLQNYYQVVVFTKNDGMACKLACNKLMSTDQLGKKIFNIYVEDLYLKYLNDTFRKTNIRDMNLCCILVHEISHGETGLPDSPVLVHFQVDQYAIGLLKQIGINWADYNKALFNAEGYTMTREGNGEAFLRLLSITSAVTTGIGQTEWDDLPDRENLIYRKYRPTMTWRESLAQGARDRDWTLEKDVRDAQ